MLAVSFQRFHFMSDSTFLALCLFIEKISLFIVIRNGKIVRRHGSKRPFFTLMLEPILLYHTSEYKRTQKQGSMTVYGPTFLPFFFR